MGVINNTNTTTTNNKMRLNPTTPMEYTILDPAVTVEFVEFVGPFGENNPLPLTNATSATIPSMKSTQFNAEQKAQFPKVKNAGPSVLEDKCAEEIQYACHIQLQVTVN